MKQIRWGTIGSALVLSILTAAPAGSVFAQAQGGGGAAAAPRQQTADPQRFDQDKARLLKFMDARIQSLQKAQSCVQAAGNRDQLRDCRRQEREAMRAQHGQGGRGWEGMRGPRGGPDGRGPGPGAR